MKTTLKIHVILVMVLSLLFFTGCTEDEQTLIADAGEDIVVVENELFTFDGSNSYDKNGNKIVSYEWYCTELEISLYKGPNSTLTIPAQREPGTYSTKLTIINDKNEVAVDHFKVTVLESLEDNQNANTFGLGITATEFKELQSQGVVYIDIRTPEEWRATGIIEGSHLIINPSNINSWLQNGSDFLNLVTSKDQEFVLICSSGSRAYLASNALKDLGYTNVHYLTGGIAPWINSGEPVVNAN